MKRFSLVLSVIALLLTLGCAIGRAAAPTNGPAGLDELRKQFESTIRDVQRQAQDSAQGLQQRYLAGLTSLEEALQSAGKQLSAIIAVRAEKERFEQSGDIPDSALSTDLTALRKLQDVWRAQTAGGPREQAQKIVAASERYLQNLGLLQKNLAARNDTRGVDEVKAEKDHLLGNNRVREALALIQSSTPATTPPNGRGPSTLPAQPVKPPEHAPVVPAATVVELGDYKFYPPGKEPPLKDLRPLRLESPTADQRSAQFFYELRVGITSDKSAYSVRNSSDDYSVTKVKTGKIASNPRITIASRNRDVPEGCKLVIEYFSQPPSRANDLRREKVEHIPLPPITRSRSYTVDAKGITLSKYESRDTVYGHTASGRDYYGLIVSIYDAEDKLLFQQCAPPAVASQCGTKLPKPIEPVAYEGPHRLK